jgi:hypothetical protein
MAAAATRPGERRLAAPTLSPLALGIVLWVAGAIVSGFTMRRYLEPFDEGLLLQVATRVAAGQWPYRDFGWAYGPGQPLAIALAFKAFAPSVVWWRVLRVAADATIALLVWLLARREADERWALAGWAAAAVTIAQPTTANPFAPALAFALAAVLAAARGRPAVAGVLAALAAFWRPDIGAAAAVAAVVTAFWPRPLPRAVATMSPPAGPTSAGLRPVPRSRAAVALLATRVRRAAGALKPARRGGRGGSGRWLRIGRGRAGRPVRGGPRPRHAGPKPFRGGPDPALTTLATALLAGVVLYAPFLLAAGPSRLWESLIAEAARDGSWWGLPFPLSYDGPLHGLKDAKDVLGFYLPLIGVVAAAATLLASWRRRSPTLAGLVVLGLGSVAYLLSRPDELHIQPLLICVCAALPIAASGAAGRGWAGRLVPGVLAPLLALILLAGLANRLSALILPPNLEPVSLRGVPGIRVPPAEARALPALARRVDALVPPGEPIYVAPRRSDLVTISDPLIHFLVHRPNVLHRDVLIQARPKEQDAIVAVLKRTRPKAIVRWTDPASARPEPNRRGRPTGDRSLDEFLAASYREDARYGAYVVLVPR